jgi:hypothetical protein
VYEPHALSHAGMTRLPKKTTRHEPEMNKMGLENNTIGDRISVAEARRPFGRPEESPTRELRAGLPTGVDLWEKALSQGLLIH